MLLCSSEVAACVSTPWLEAASALLSLAPYTETRLFAASYVTAPGCCRCSCLCCTWACCCSNCCFKRLFFWPALTCERVLFLPVCFSAARPSLTAASLSTTDIPVNDCLSAPCCSTSETPFSCVFASAFSPPFFDRCCCGSANKGVCVSPLLVAAPSGDAGAAAVAAGGLLLVVASTFEVR